MSKSFAELFEESLTDVQIQPGSIVKAEVIAIRNSFVVISAGLKSEGFVPIEQFHNESGELEVAVGDHVDVALDAFEDGFGETIFSREKAKRQEAWIELGNAHETGEAVLGVVTGKVKGGFTVELCGKIRAFLPGSLVDVRPVHDSVLLDGKQVEFKVIKMDPKRNNVVVSRRAIVEATDSIEREALLKTLEEGQEIVGTVKNLTDYGAFVDLGGIDGLLHITDMSWRRVKHPSEIVKAREEICVKILKFDRERSRVSLGLKQLGEDPWINIERRYPVDFRLFGKVTNLTDYGCFVEIEEGVEGLVHVSEMDWTNKNIHPKKVVQVGDEVEVLVLEIDGERRRISLGIKQCKPNPWQSFSEAHASGEKIKGSIKSITDFGVFIGLEGGIDGLVHLSDLSWDKSGEEAVRDYKRGQEIETVILGIDSERERISLGIKQLEGDAFSNFLESHDKGSKVNAKVLELEPKSVLLELTPEVTSKMGIEEMYLGSDDFTKVLRIGDRLEVYITQIDKKAQTVAVVAIPPSMRHQKEKIAPTATIGDLLKAKMDK